LEKGIAEGAGFIQFGLGLDLFGNELDAAAAEALSRGAPRVGVRGAKVDFEEAGEREKRFPFGVVDKIVDSQNVAGAAEILAVLDHLRRGNDGFENLNDNAVGRQQARGATLKRSLVQVDESLGGAGKRLEVEEHHGVDDDATGGFRAELEDILVAARTKQEFVREELELVVEDGLAGDEFFVHGEPFLERGENAARVFCVSDERDVEDGAPNRDAGTTACPQRLEPDEGEHLGTAKAVP